MNFVNKKTALLLAATLFFTVAPALSHCQIPCGIYDDQTRINLLSEHITTIEKAMNSINDLSKKISEPNHHKHEYNQLVRWINNKDDHAQQANTIITYYFMAQRIKPASAKSQNEIDKYTRQLTLLHRMLVQFMKAKQSTDTEIVKQLRTLLEKFENLYMSAKK